MSAHPRTHPANPKTAGQEAIRQVYRWLAGYVAEHGTMASAPIELYAGFKKTTKLGPLVADNVKLLRNATTLEAFVPHRVSFGVPSFSGIAVTPLSGRLRIAVGSTGGANGYTPVYRVFHILRDQDPHGVYVMDTADYVGTPTTTYHTFTGLASGQPYFCWAYPMGLNPKGQLGAGAPLTAMGTPL